MHYHSTREKEYILYYRFWWTLWDSFQISGDFNFFDKSFAVVIATGRRMFQIHIALPFILSFWLTFGHPHSDDEDSLDTGIKIHNWALWWEFFRDPMGGWSSKTPRWRAGSFHIDDFLFGKAVHSSEVLEEREITVPMPEKAYAGIATRTMDRWKYPRWFTKELMRVEIEVKEGIPHEGKGENSYDCGPTATYSSMVPARSIPEAVGKMVGYSLATRVKYGGWDDWEWKKMKETTPENDIPGALKEATS